MIGAVLASAALLGACSTLKLGYANGAQLTWWWADGYLDYPSDTAPRAKAAVERFFDWHHATQAAPSAALLEQTAAEILQPASAEQVCRWEQRFRELADVSIERALAQAAELAPQLTDAQIRHLDERFAKKRAEWRREWVQPDRQERQQAQLQRVVERAERVYGRLGEPQRQAIAAALAGSPWDAEGWLAERERRHRDIVQTLARLKAERADRDTALAALRTLAERQQRSPDPAWRAHQQRSDAFGCQVGAQVHNATTAAQRQAARERLLGWAADLRAVAAQSMSSAAAGAGAGARPAN